jgi:hypothetical protein
MIVFGLVILLLGLSLSSFLSSSGHQNPANLHRFAQIFCDSGFTYEGFLSRISIWRHRDDNHPDIACHFRLCVFGVGKQLAAFRGPSVSQVKTNAMSILYMGLYGRSQTASKDGIRYQLWAHMVL